MTERTTDYVLDIYCRDLRFRNRERLVKSEQHNGVTPSWMTHYAGQVRDSERVSRVEVREQWTTVRNLMSGADVVIRTEDRGGVCDPSQERYWTM